MAININNLKNTNQIQQKVEKKLDTQNNIQQKSAPQVKSAQTDSVVLTSQAKQLKSLEKKAGEPLGMNQMKIDELKQAIESGDYKINPEKLAANIAKYELNL